MDDGSRYRPARRRAGQTDAERLHRKLQRQTARRRREDRGLADRLRHQPSAQFDRQPDAGSLRCGKRHRDATGQAAAVHEGLRASPRSANRKNRAKSRTDSTPNRVGSWPQTSGSVPGGWSATAAKPARPRSIYRHTPPAKVKVRSFLSPRSAPYRTDSEPVPCSGPAKSGTCLRSASANCRKRTGIAMQPSIAAARQRAARSRRAFSNISAKGRQSRHHRTLPARRGRRPSGRLSSLDTATKSGAARSATGRRRL